jgi:hypothetical protein
MSFSRGARTGGFPLPGEIRGDVPGPHSRDGWQFIAEHASIQLQGKQYRHMKEWSRPCAVCGAHFSIFEKIGTVDANGRFSNKTCDAHRGLLPAMNKGLIRWDISGNKLVAGLMLGADPSGLPEIEQLREANRMMKEELEGLYADLQEYTQKFGKLGVKKPGPW